MPTPRNCAANRRNSADRSRGWKAKERGCGDRTAGELAAGYKAALAEADRLDEEFNLGWVTLPNLTDDSAADGLGEEDAVEVSRWGDPVVPERSQGPRRPRYPAGGSRHRACLPVVRDPLWLPVGWSRPAGIRPGAVCLRPSRAARLRPVVPPVLVREEALFGTGFFPGDRQQVYAIEKDDLYLVGTSEVSLAALHMDEILDAGDLPLRYVGFSTCFAVRQELTVRTPGASSVCTSSTKSRCSPSVIRKPLATNTTFCWPGRRSSSVRWGSRIGW